MWIFFWRWLICFINHSQKIMQSAFPAQFYSLIGFDLFFDSVKLTKFFSWRPDKCNSCDYDANLFRSASTLCVTTCLTTATLRKPLHRQKFLRHTPATLPVTTYTYMTWKWPFSNESVIAAAATAAIAAATCQRWRETARTRSNNLRGLPSRKRASSSSSSSHKQTVTSTLHLDILFSFNISIFWQSLSLNICMYFNLSIDL